MKGKFYDGTICDETCSRRLVGFHSKQRDTLATMSRTAVTLDNCTIKKSKFSDEMEVVVNHSTNVCKSPKNQLNKNQHDKYP